MKKILNHSTATVFCLAVVFAGLLAFAYLMGRQTISPLAPQERFQNIFATASDNQNGCLLASGYFNSNIEALYYLDTQSVRLSAAVLSRIDPTFLKTYTRDLRTDLAEAASKLQIPVPNNPSFAMVTGDVDVRQMGGSDNFSKSFVYIAETGSGIVLVYGIPVVGDRDLEVSGGDLIFWTFARLNQGSGTATGSPSINAAPSQDPQTPRSINASFFK